MTLKDGEILQDKIDEIIGYIAKNRAEPDETVRNDFADRPSCIAFRARSVARHAVVRAIPAPGAAARPLFYSEDGVVTEDKY